MRQGEQLLASRLLRMAADHYGNHCCNDIDKEMFEGISADEKHLMEVDWNAFNCPRLDKDQYVPFDHIGDYAWMAYFARQLSPAQRGAV